MRSAEGRRQDVPATKQTNCQTAGGGDQGERQGEEEEEWRLTLTSCTRGQR